MSAFLSVLAGISPAGHEQSAALGVGLLAHPDKIAVTSAALAHQQGSGLNMWLLIAEMVLALGLIVFIMWWTLRARVDHPVHKNEAEGKQTEDTSNKE
jgi:hypothetical protein